MTTSRFVVVTGLSGAGKSQVMKSFEDLGFYCLDNLPPALVLQFVTLARSAGIERIALSLGSQHEGPLGSARSALAELERHGVPFELLYLDADDDALVRRYSETRRPHPRDPSRPLARAIEAERAELAPLRARATVVLDTSDCTHAMLREKVAAAFAPERPPQRLTATVVSFGFKHGVPREADLVFDVRFLPNPNYVEGLRTLTGADSAVAEYMERLPQTEAFLSLLFGLLDFLIPLYRAEGKSRLTIAIGCTGGRHRSVYIARRLGAHLAERDDIALAREDRELVTA